jgi:hypothetical protein
VPTPTSVPPATTLPALHTTPAGVEPGQQVKHGKGSLGQ